MRRHIVLGAGGALGSAIVRGLSAAGEDVVAVLRNTSRGINVFSDSVPVRRVDARQAHQVSFAVHDADIVYHCLNVPYRDWQRLMPTITSNVLQAACTREATLVFIGNVYGYGPLGDAPVSESYPLRAASRKGVLRNQLEQTLRKAHREGRIQLVLPRFPDYYGPNVTNRLFGPIFQAALRGGKAFWPGRLDVPHALIPVEDAAQACIHLSQVPEARGETWHVPGPPALTGGQFLELVYASAGRKPRYGGISKMALRAIGIVSSDARELVELQYQFTSPLLMDGRKFSDAFAQIRFTPHEVAIRETLQWFRERDQAALR